MGWLSFLTGKSETAEKVVDGAIDGIDAMFYTEEEKARANFQILEWKLEYAKATQGMSISRRVIAFTVSGAWLLCVILLIVLGVTFGKEADAVKWMFKVLDEIVNEPFMIIIGFYFLAHVVGSARGK